ncbi:MAG: twin-arginine translocase TatA/TatE family subunit [Janthinobacterium lividum]
MKNLYLFEIRFDVTSKLYQQPQMRERFIMGISASHLLLVALGFLLVFGAGRLPHIMGDFARGIRAFKKGMSEEDDTGRPSLPKDDQPTSK